jgi:hypothetical protein
VAYDKPEEVGGRVLDRERHGLGFNVVWRNYGEVWLRASTSGTRYETFHGPLGSVSGRSLKQLLATVVRPEFVVPPGGDTGPPGEAFRGGSGGLGMMNAAAPARAALPPLLQPFDVFGVWTPTKRIRGRMCHDFVEDALRFLQRAGNSSGPLFQHPPARPLIRDHVMVFAQDFQLLPDSVWRGLKFVGSGHDEVGWRAETQRLRDSEFARVPVRTTAGAGGPGGDDSARRRKQDASTHGASEPRNDTAATGPGAVWTNVAPRQHHPEVGDGKNTAQAAGGNVCHSSSVSDPPAGAPLVTPGAAGACGAARPGAQHATQQAPPAGAKDDRPTAPAARSGTPSAERNSSPPPLDLAVERRHLLRWLRMFKHHGERMKATFHNVVAWLVAAKKLGLDPYFFQHGKYYKLLNMQAPYLDACYFVLEVPPELTSHLADPKQCAMDPALVARTGGWVVYFAARLAA